MPRAFLRSIPSIPALAAAAALVVGFVACGGGVVVDDRQSASSASGASGPAGSGAAGPAGTGAAGPGPAGNGATGPGTGGGGPGCTDHTDCPFDSACVFATGECAQLCQGTCDVCGPGAVCNTCATSSCPGCEDCVGACSPLQPGQCDDDDACQPGWFCYFADSTCHPSCSNFEPSSCPPDQVCVGCAAGSCCGCDDCVDMCLPAFDDEADGG